MSCPIGTFTSLNHSACYPNRTCCEPGTISVDFQCTLCPDSTIANPITNQCNLCASHTYASLNHTICSSLGNCSDHTYSPAFGYLDNTQCIECNFNEYAQSDHSSCVKKFWECNPGSYLNITALQCQICPPGTFSKGSTQSESLPTCESCPPGMLALNNHTDCILNSFDCDVGTYAVLSLKQCYPCLNSTFSDQKHLSCLSKEDECEPGTFANNKTWQCTICPEGSIHTPQKTNCSNCSILAL